MRKLLTFVLAFIALCSCAQESVMPDSVADSTATKRVFAQIMGINKNVLGIGNKITVEIDFGLENFFWGRDGRNEVIDENGKEKKFNTMVDAMNFMGERGWEYEDSYVISFGNQRVIHFLLSKEIPVSGDSRDGIQQKRDKKKDKKKKERRQPDPNDDPLYF